MMITFGSIDFPDEILTALKNEKLVIFAGAGVSMGPPSNLPGFEELANQIAEETMYQIGEDEQDRPDVILGSMQESGHNIYELAANILNPEGVLPNSLHKDLLRIFGKSDNVRLITTNFDFLFENAVSDVFKEEINLEKAPALPLGHDFNGIVKIHGSLSKPKSMVLTDKDFGKAYFTEGWARKFLLDLFLHYSVLFVGYSHNDIVMNYMGRALPPGDAKARFILIEETSRNDRKWKGLGITPIYYKLHKKADNKHIELYESINEFADHINRGNLNIVQELSQIAQGNPPIDGAGRTKITEGMKELFSVRAILKFARGKEWFLWFWDQGYLSHLFTKNIRLTEIEKEICLWLGNNFVLNDADVLLSYISNNHLIVHPALWESILSVISTSDQPINLRTISRWASIIICTYSAECSVHMLHSFATKCYDAGAIAQVTEIFLLECQFRFELVEDPWVDFESEKFDATSKFYIDTDFIDNHFLLSDLWERYLLKNLDSCWLKLFMGLVSDLNTVSTTLSLWSGNQTPIFSIRRPAIEESKQNRQDSVLSVIVVVIRTILEWLAVVKPDELLTLTSLLLEFDESLLLRFGLYGLTINSRLSDDKKIKFLIGFDKLFDSYIKHEVLQLIRNSIQKAHPETQTQLIKKILSKELQEESPDTHQRTDIFHLHWLKWIEVTVKDNRILNKRLRTLSEVYPKAGSIDHLDYFTWSTGSWNIAEPPYPIETLITKRFRDAYNDYFDLSEDHFKLPNKEGFLSLLSRVVKQNLNWSLSFAEFLLQENYFDISLWKKLILSWETSEFTEEQQERVINIMSVNRIFEDHQIEISRLLPAMCKKMKGDKASELLGKSNTIADSIWSLANQEEQFDSKVDWISKAMNSTAGNLMEFWIQSLQNSIDVTSVELSELPSYYRNIFEPIIVGTDLRSSLARPILTKYSNYFFTIFPNWTKSHILGLFAHESDEVFLQAWEGFLLDGRLQKDLSITLSSTYVAASGRLEVLNYRKHLKFLTNCANIAFYYQENPLLFTKKILSECSALAPESYCEKIEIILAEGETENNEIAWDRWLKAFLKSRLSGIPKPITNDESLNILSWLPHLGSRFPDATKLMNSLPIGQLDNLNFLDQIQGSSLIQIYPCETAQLLLLVVRHIPDRGFEQRFELPMIREIYKAISTMDDDIRHELLEEFIRLSIE